MNKNNINLSTIGIGSDADKELLTHLAQDGHGRYYFTEQPENIPQIVFKEVDLSLKQAILEGTVQPHLSATSPLLNGFKPQDIPQIGGYDITVAKDAAVTALTTDLGDPLLAHWNYGLGRVVAYTSDVATDWGQKWLSWDGFAQFWDQALRWSMSSPVSHLLQPSIAYSASADASTGLAHISAESLNADNSFADLASITAGLRAPSGVVTTTVLMQTAPGHYQADVPVSEVGAYEVRVQRAGSQNGSDPPVTETIGFTVPTAAEYLNAGTNDQLLKRLNSGKPYLTQPAQALDPSALAGNSPQREPLWPYTVAPALFLLLGSVAARRVDFRRARRR